MPVGCITVVNAWNVPATGSVSLPLKGGVCKAVVALVDTQCFARPVGAFSHTPVLLFCDLRWVLQSDCRLHGGVVRAEGVPGVSSAQAHGNLGTPMGQPHSCCLSTGHSWLQVSRLKLILWDPHFRHMGTLALLNKAHIFVRFTRSLDGKGLPVLSAGQGSADFERLGCTELPQLGSGRFGSEPAVECCTGVQVFWFWG
jgi:hypothetical protein